ncbi:MAG: hypothetical protein KC931_01955 [Candidatus Omnitrophica bacterium]|nr:hypothetical protein [Candidatus Omnitrophota bacterium]
MPLPHRDHNSKYDDSLVISKAPEGGETGLVRHGGGETNIGDYFDTDDLAYMAESGVDFSYLRAYIDYMNSIKVDLSVASTMGAATVRNKDAMGIQNIESPGGAS